MNKKSRMFHLDKDYPIKTWNPISGCKHNCKYCWARIISKKLENHKDFDNPKFFENELKRKFRENEIVFVVDMGDMFGSWIPGNWIIRILNVVRENPKTLFFFETKNPKRYFEFLNLFPNNVILSSTIESNIDHGLSLAPPEKERYENMAKISKIMGKDKIHISIEPILDFDPYVFFIWIKEINPRIVSIGYDNYYNNLPEPELNKTLSLIKEMGKSGIYI
jgi:DNA repair photolyase